MPWSSIGVILGKRAQTTHGEIPEYRITRLKLRDVRANRFDPPRHFFSRYRVFWCEKSGPEADRERLAFHDNHVTNRDGCRMNVYQYFIILGRRFCDVVDLKHIQ